MKTAAKSLVPIVAQGFRRGGGEGSRIIIHRENTVNRRQQKLVIAMLSAAFGKML